MAGKFLIIFDGFILPDAVGIFKHQCIPHSSVADRSLAFSHHKNHHNHRPINRVVTPIE